MASQPHSITGAAAISQAPMRDQTPHPPLPTFRLFDLPQELVDMIYAEMLRAGDTGILRTSRNVHSRALQFLELHGVCRVVGKQCRYADWFWLEARDIELCSVRSIRNVEIRLTPERTDLVSEKTRSFIWPSTSQSHLLQCPMGGNPTPFDHRSRCKVIIEADLSNVSEQEIRNMFSVLFLFKGFGRLSIIYALTPQAHYFQDGRFPGFDERMKVYGVIEQRLSCLMGPATAVGGDRETKQGVEFFPWSHDKSPLE